VPILRWSLTAVFTLVFVWLSLRQLKRKEHERQMLAARSKAREFSMRPSPLSDAEYRARREALTEAVEA
jgi:hypothetical protein